MASDVRILSAFLCICVLTSVTAEDPKNQTPGSVAIPAKVHADTGTRHQVLGFLFDESILADNVLGTISRVGCLPPDEQFAELCRCVVPAHERASFRVHAVFSQTDRPPELALSGKFDAIQCINSPVLQLLAVAKREDHLAELKQRVAAIPDPAEPHQLRAKLAMLFMIDATVSDLDSARTHLAAITELVRTREPNVNGSWWPETLALAFAMKSDPGSAEVQELAAAIFDPQITQSQWSGNDAWDHFVAACFSSINDADRSDPAIESAVDVFANWIPATVSTTETRSVGIPRATWQKRGNSVRKFAGHHNDYLFLPMPLVGDFEVQCDVTGFNYREAQLAYADGFASHFWTTTEVDVGNIRKHDVVPLDTPMTYPDDWLSARIVVKDGIAKHYVNGRNLVTRTLPVSHSPWVAVRVYRLSHGSIRNLTVTGKPQIPTSVDLISPPNLDGWFSYFAQPVAITDDPLSWKCVDGGSGPAEIGRDRQPHLKGTQAEGLLLYARPMAEDGIIEYDFFYVPSEIAVFPAFDRLAFVFTPDGVRTHWTTNGKFERAGNTEKLQIFPALAKLSDAAATAIPLRQNAWNHVELSLTGATVDFKLNGRPVCSYELNKSNSRQFGLFHFPGETSVRVRNIRWTGGWPHSIRSPDFPPGNQPDVTKLEEMTANLPESFELDFREKNLPTSQVRVRCTDVVATDAGLKMSVESPGNWIQTEAFPSLKVSGNFDLRASFAKFRHSDKGTTGVQLMATLEDTLQEIRLARTRGDNSKQELKTEVVNRNAEGERQPISNWITNEATSGTLRLVRLGNTLSYLFAEDDSSVYRVLGSDEIGVEDLSMGSIAVSVLADLGGRGSVEWTKLSVRADRLSGGATVDVSTELVAINKQRVLLPQSEVFDFEADPQAAGRLFHWGPQRPWNAADRGLTFTAAGSNDWTSRGFSMSTPIFGDFDIQLEFDKLQLATPGDGHQSVVFLEVEPFSARKTQLTAMVGVEPAGIMEAEGYTRSLLPDGTHEYGGMERTPISNATGLRIVRRGSRYSMLVRPKGNDDFRIVSISENTEIPIRSVKVMIHTGGAGRTSSMLVKRLEVRANRIGNPPATIINKEPRQ